MQDTKTKQQVIQHLEQNVSRFIRMSDDIWEYPELGWKEFKASRRQADFLEKEGFTVTWNIAEISTAFVAEWGEGKPLIGFIGEYDALPGLSQKNQAKKEALIKGAPGHGCGHNLLGTGAVAGAFAVQNWLKSSGTPGTVRYYGCPAEEAGGGKVFMAKAGIFDDLDAAFNYHPGSFNAPSKGSCVAVNHIHFRFHGRTAHAGGSPHEGRSALDAVELMNVGVNYLREHVKDDVRMHYIITNGGTAPNIVPEEAEVFYYIRAAKPDYLEEVTDRVRKIAKGATFMTETSVEEIFKSAYSNVLSNHYLADLQYQAMELIGPIAFSDEEMAYAQKINDAYPRTNSDYIDDAIEYLKPPPEIVDILEAYRDKPLVGENFPALDEKIVGTGSTDVGDLSWVTPVSMLSTTCFTTASTGHSWGNVATSAHSIGHKGMMHAAKIMAVSAVDLYTDPEHLEKIREEFEKKAGTSGYKCPLPDHIKPPRYEPEQE
ncbi:MAG: amidohydrolase [Deltaproteobacteria bacterium]|nr:amidohydrolase [Deltaproteobacteria bacterium]